MNILVTGANGFIGKHLCNFLEKELYKVFRVVRKNKDTDSNTFESELADKNSVEELIKNLRDEKIDMVIHLASKLANGSQSEDEQVQVLVDNIAITKNMVELIKELKPKKLINFSSMAVYPNIDGYFNEESIMKMSVNSDCMYGLSKFCSENIFDFMLKNQEILISHLRVSQVYGEGMYKDRIMPMMIQELKDKNIVTVYGNGERESNFINVNKLVELINYFIKNQIHGIYNIGEESLSYLQLAQKIISKNGNNDSKIIKKEEGSKAKFKLNTDRMIKNIRK